MFSFEVFGEEIISRAFSGVAERIGDWRGAWPEVNRRFERLERNLFESGGATGAHGSWPEDKRLRGQRGESHPPMIRTGALEQSLTQLRSPHAIVEMEPTEFTRGSSLNYARAHMERRGNRPARRPIDPTSEQVQKETLSPLKDEAKRIGQREGFVVSDD